MKALRSILGLIRHADQKFDLFHEGDKIMLGISGGKDSMLLALAMKQYQMFDCANFEIVPAILDLGFPGFDAKPIKKYFKSIGLELKVIDSKDVYQILKVQQKDAKILPCSICSRMKKAAINKAAKELGCNKVAFAHHGDDAVETLFMNEIFGGRIATFQPKMFLERAEIEFIRPLILVHEKDIIRAIKEENIPSFSSHCPNDGNTMRHEMKNMLNDIYKKYPSAKDNFFLMLENYEKEQLYYHDLFYKIERENISFKPVINARDARIELKIRDELSCKNFSEDINRYIIYMIDKPIGIISFDKKEITKLVDFYLYKEYKNKEKVILDFIDNNIKHFLCPIIA